MKKNYTLLAGLILSSCVTFSQNEALRANMQLEQSALSPSPIFVDSGFQSKTSNVNFNSKAFQDILYSEDFSSGTATSPPTGWTIMNNNVSNNFQWVWNTVYQNGQFSNATDIITSATAANGFMVLTGDFFNTPFPIGGPVALSTYFESPTITIANPRASYWVRYDQAVRYCCNQSNRLVLQASTDNFATIAGEFDATNGIAVGQASNTINYINISSAVGGASSFKIRFLSEGNTHYYWMIDDLTIIEGAANDMQMDDPYLEFNFNYSINPFYHEIPYALFPPLPVSANIRNNGSNTATGVTLKADISHQSYPNGTIGTGLVYSATSLPITMPSGATLNDTSYYTISPDTGSTDPRFIPTVLGNFSVDIETIMDSADQWNTVIGIDTYSQSFNTVDTSLRRVDYTLGGGTGPGSYTRNGLPGGQIPGDAFGTLVIIESPVGVTDAMKTPTSITYIVSNDTSQIGVEITPTIWAFDETAATLATAFGSIVASSFVPYTVTSASIGNPITLAFNNGSAVTGGLPDGQYVIGWTVINPNQGRNFEVQTDNSTGQFQDVSSFINLAHQPGWGFVDENPAIILNMGMLPLSTNINTVSAPSATFNIVPNPNNGEFNLTVSSTEKVNYDLNVRNVLGQTVYTESITINGTFTESMNLTHFEKGLYFVSLENGTEKLLKKVLVK